METDTQHLRDSLIRSLQHQPLLVEAETSLHSSMEQDLIDEFRAALMKSLHSAPPLAKVHRQGFRDLNDDLIDQFRSAMRDAVRSGDNLAMSEVELLSALDLEKLGEFRSQLGTHLEGEPEISQEDLAIYVPAGLGIAEEFRRSLAVRPPEIVEPEVVDTTEISAEPEMPEHRPVQRYAPGAYVVPVVHAADEQLELDEQERRTLQPYVPGAYVDRVLREDQEELKPAAVGLETVRDDPKPGRADAALIAGSLRAGMEGADAPQTQDTGGTPAADAPSAHGLTAIPTLTAALEAIGSKGDDYGFIVRYGRYAPEGRRSEFLVGGLGFSELSKRLTSWLESHASLDDQVQVLDEGSGELTIYLLGAEKQN